MPKKSICVLLVLILAFFAMLPAAAADCGKIAVYLPSNIAGLTKRDAQKLIELKTDNVRYQTGNGGPILIADYGGTPEDGALVAGRTYDIYYSLTAAEGFELPEKLADGSLEITCGKGVSVISSQIVWAPIRLVDGSFMECRGLRIFARVVVDGNAFQRFLGMIHDWILKIKAWSLY